MAAEASWALAAPVCLQARRWHTPGLPCCPARGIRQSARSLEQSHDTCQPRQIPAGSGSQRAWELVHPRTSHWCLFLIRKRLALQAVAAWERPHETSVAGPRSP